MFKYIDVKYTLLEHGISNNFIFSVDISFLPKSSELLQQFENEIIAETAWFINTLPDDVTEINLSGNSLGDIQTNNIIRLIQAAKSNVASLNLCWNELYQKNGAQLAELFNTISGNIAIVNLSWNNLYLMKIDELHHAFSGINSNVIWLDLSWNYLGNQTNDFLIVLFLSIHSGVKTLDLRGNNLNQKTPYEIDLIFRHLPPGVEIVYLDDGKIYKPGSTKSNAASQTYTSQEITVTRTVSRTQSIDGPHGFFTRNDKQTNTETLSQLYYEQKY